ENGAPTVTATYNVGNDLLTEVEEAAEGEVPTAAFTLETEFVTSATWNVIGETKAGDHAQVQMFGAHRDAVAEGHGVNANGAGSAARLASAEDLAEQPSEVDDAIRFGWWGGEEVGLVGSTEYVEGLSEAELGKIKAYMDSDMIGSDNF